MASARDFISSERNIRHACSADVAEIAGGEHSIVGVRPDLGREAEDGTQVGRRVPSIDMTDAIIVTAGFA